MFKFLPVDWHDSLPSTNTYLVAALKETPKLPSGTVVVAREQHAGRGRQHRPWLTPPNQNLTFSFVWRETMPEQYVPAMAQALSVGIAQFLQGYGLTPTIKWPNDLLVEGKKIGGILCERVNLRDSSQVAVVAGIGLNVNLDAVTAAKIDQPATSILLETGLTGELPTVLDELLEQLVAPLHAWSQRGFPGIRADYEAFGWARGSAIRVRDGESYLSGNHGGYNEDGALVLKVDGGEKICYSGDIGLA